MSYQVVRYFPTEYGTETKGVYAMYHLESDAKDYVLEWERVTGCKNVHEIYIIEQTEKTPKEQKMKYQITREINGQTIVIAAFLLESDAIFYVRSLAEMLDMPSIYESHKIEEIVN